LPPSHNIPVGDQVIGEDDDLIIASIESPPFATSVQLVTCVGGGLVKQGDFWRRTLVFEVLYVHSF
jgi:hypothetical protein